MQKYILFAISVFSLFIPTLTAATYGDTVTYLSKPYWGDHKNRLKAFFDFPEDIAFNSKGGMVIADTRNNAIRRIKPDGTVRTVAGTGSYGDTIGARKQAEFAFPGGVDTADGVVYVADTENDKIKKIKDGQVTTLVSGLNEPEAVKVHGSTLYFLDTGNNALKKVSINGGAVTTVSASLSDPKKFDITSDGRYAYIANAGTHQIKRVDLQTTTISTVAGTGNEGDNDGSCAEATFNNLWGVHVYDDDTLFVTDGDGFTDMVRTIDLTGCTVSVFASDINMLSINFPHGITSHDGYLYAVATGIGIIQRYLVSDPSQEELFAGANRFNVKDEKPVLAGQPKFMLLSNDKDTIYFSENNRIRKVNRDNLKKSTLIAGSVVDNYNADDTKTWTGDVARFSDITSMALSTDGKKLYVVDRNNNRIKEVVIATGAMSYLTGAGQVNMVSGDENGFANGDPCPNEFDAAVSGCAYFNRPTGVVISPDGEYLYVTDASNNRIRRVTLTGSNKGHVTTIAGSGDGGLKDGTGTAAQFDAPIGLAINEAGTVLYVVDRNNHAVRQITLSDNYVGTLFGNGDAGYIDGEFSAARLSTPEWITVGKDGNVYFTEAGTSMVRMADLTARVTKLVAGSGDRGYMNGNRTSVEFDNPKGLLALKNKVLVAEMQNDTIRCIDIRGDAPFTDPAPEVTSLATNQVAKEWYPNGQTTHIEVRGKNFRYGAVAYFGSHEAVKTYVDDSGNSLVAEIPMGDMPAGYYTVRVENSDGQYDDLVNAFAVSQNGNVPGSYYSAAVMRVATASTVDQLCAR